MGRGVENERGRDVVSSVLLGEIAGELSESGLSPLCLNVTMVELLREAFLYSAEISHSGFFWLCAKLFGTM